MSTKTSPRTRKVEDDKDNYNNNNNNNKYNDTDNDAGDNETMKARERDLYGEVSFLILWIL